MNIPTAPAFDPQDGIPIAIWFQPATEDRKPYIAIETYGHVGGKPYLVVWLDPVTPWEQRLGANWNIHETGIRLWSHQEKTA